MSKFTDAIDRNWNSNHFAIAPGATTSCDECFWGLSQKEKNDLSDEDKQAWDEGSFSWSDCNSCGSLLGGDRFPAHAIEHNPNHQIYHIDICVDCLMFHANGDKPEIWE